MITHETATWFIDGDRCGGVLLVRKADAASVYMQGEEAAETRRNVEKLEAISGAAFPGLFDAYCTTYSEVLETDTDYSHR